MIAPARILLALALVTGLGACGSGAGMTGASGPAAKADAICASARAQARLITAPANLLTDASAAAGYFHQVFALVHRETGHIQALPPPADPAVQWRAFVAAQVAYDHVLRTLRQKADAKDPSGVAYYGKLAPAIQSVTSAAKKVGATTCAGRQPA